MHTSFSDVTAKATPADRWLRFKKKDVTRTTIVESGLSHEGKSIRMLQFAVNIYLFSLTTIDFP